MSNDQEEVIDATEEKAKSIGKELGTEDESPDYEIQEEDDDASIAKERNDESRQARAEREKLSNREKRQLRKKKVNEKFNEKDAIIRAQQEKLEHFERRLSEVDGRLSGINRAEVDKAIYDTNMAFSQAEKTHAEAFNEGDGAKATLAMRAMYDAQRKLEQLGSFKQQLDRTPSQVQTQSNQPDRVVVNKAKEWAEKNAWYNSDGSDTDSEVAKAISGALVKDGYDPKSDDFWEELDDRLMKYMPDKIQASDDDEDEDEAPALKPRKRATPPVSGASNRGDVRGKKTITLPTSYINTLKANGIWDDIPRRNKILADRERIIREQRQ